MIIKTPIQPIGKEITIDNSTTELTNFWEKNNASSPISDNPSDHVINLIKKAQETIVAYSPYIIHHIVQRELELASQKGVRIYYVTKNLERHERAITKGIMREKTDIDSSFLIIDHQKTSKAGIWFSGEITSQSTPQPSIELNSTQISGLMHQFNHFFWQPHSRELNNGKIINAKPRKPKLDEVPSEFKSILRYVRVSHYLNNETLLELWVDDSYPNQLQYLWPEADKIVFTISDSLKHADINQINDVTGHFSLPFSYIKTPSNSIIYRKDLGIILTGKQQLQLDKEMKPFPWQYNKSKSFSEINNDLILNDNAWKESNHQQIQTTTTIHLDDYIPEQISTWQKELNQIYHPSLSTQRHLSKTITYKWVLKPPYLPNDAQKSVLYQQWTTYTSNLEKTITQLDNLIQQLISEKILNDNTEIQEISKSIFELKVDPYHDSNNSHITHTIESAHARLIQILTPLRTSFDKTGNEMEVFSNRIQSIYDKLTSLSISKKSTPSLPLPSIGELYETKNTRYLVIQYIEDIRAAEEIKNRYNSKIVVNYE